ncbi:ABC transporter permease, partial [Gemmatimonadota bacterium]
LGTVLALWLQRLILLFLPVEFLGIHEFRVSLPMLLFALGLSLVTALLFGSGPALFGARTTPAAALTQGRRSSATKDAARVRSGLVVLQVALSVVLLVGSGLMVRSFVRLLSEELGFQAENLLTADLQIPGSKYPEAVDRTRFFSELQEEIEALPGVREASFVSMIPIRQRWMDWGVWIPEHPPRNETENVGAFARTVLPGYFAAMGIPLVSGRDHEPEDKERDRPVIVINESLAGALFPGEDPIGKQMATGSPAEPWVLEVIGVVRDARITAVDREADHQMYFPHTFISYSTMELVVRSQNDPAALVGPIRELLRNRDPDVPLAGVVTMAEIISESLVLNRVVAVMTGLFALVALLLAATGLYGVLAYFVGRRTHEIGVRVAIGARAGDILALVVGKGLRLVGVGLVVGVGGALAATRLIRSFLYQVEPTDPGTFGGVILGFLAVGALACLLPAWRAVRLDPVKAIQSE